MAEKLVKQTIIDIAFMCQHCVKMKEKLTMLNRRSRKYQLTFNNPIEYGCTHEAIKERLKKWENLVYGCLCDEIGEQGTPHTHLFIQAKNPLYFNSIKKVFPSAHIEEAIGTAEENKAYIRKEGKWEDTEKECTNLKETFEEFGTMPETGYGRSPELAQLYQMLKDGYSNVEILETNPDNILKLQQIDKARLEILYDKYKNERRMELLVTYVWGDTGVGKSKNILDMHGDSNVYRATDYKHPFDSYTGEDVLVFEEFRSDLSIGSMLNYLDIYPLQLPARYNNRQACYRYVYIVSNWRLEEQYQNIQHEHPKTWQAFIRRIHKVRIYTDLGVWEEYETTEYLNRFHKIRDGEKTPFD